MNTNTGGPGPPDNSDDMDTINNKDSYKDLKLFNLTNKYTIKDKGPFYVFVEHLNKNFGRLFPMKIGYFLLTEDKFKQNIVDIISVGVSRVKVIFKNYDIANSLVGHEIMEKNQLVAYIPTFYNHRKGLVRWVDTFFSEDFLLKNIECDNMKVVKVQRMKRRVTDGEGEIKFVDRQLIIVTFEGNFIPEKIKINLTSFSVEPYVHPVVQCYSCLRYGHTAKLCKSKSQRCQICTEVHTKDSECPNPGSFCIYCQTNNHPTISKECPMYTKQHNIKREMAFKNISFKEAETIVNNPSYSKITTNNRFAVFNNTQNFPPLPVTSQSQYIPPAYMLHKPTAPSKKRKASTPPITPPPTSSKKTDVPKAPKTAPIIPNPHRDDFVQYKEKVIENIINFIHTNFDLKSSTSTHLNPLTDSNTRDFIATALEFDTIDTVSISDESSY